MGFDSLQHIRARRSTSARAFACPLRSALRVWLPSRRFTPFVTRAGFVSHRQRSWDLPFGAFSSQKVSRPFPAGSTHIPFRPSVYLRTRRCEGRLDGPRFLGFDPSESPSRPSMCLAHRPLDAPLGLALPRYPAEAWIEISPDLLSRASSGRLTPADRRLRVSISLCFASSAQRASPLG